MDKRRHQRRAWRLVNQVWAEFDAPPSRPVEDDGDAAGAAFALRQTTHRTIRAVTEAIEGFRFNSAVARIYEFTAALRLSSVNGGAPAVAAARREALSALARLIAPFAPHLAEECWEKLGETGLVAQAPWPTYEVALVEDAERVLPVQINGKRRGEVREQPAGASKATVERIVFDDPEIRRRLEALTVRQVIVVTDRIVNLVAD